MSATTRSPTTEELEKLRAVVARLEAKYGHRIEREQPPLRLIEGGRGDA